MDILATSPTCRVAIHCGLKVQEHIRLVVFALFECFVDECLNVFMLP